MRRILGLVVVLVACGPTPIAYKVAEPAEEPATTEPADEPEPTSATSPDGLYTCRTPSGPVKVTLREGITARDLAIWYLAVSCTHVMLPEDLAGRSRATGLEETLTPAQIEPRFRALLSEMGLALVRDHGAAMIVDQSWLALSPALVIVRPVDATGADH